VKKGDFKPCEAESQVCLDGICSNSVCRRYGLTECQCSETKYQCYVCCNFLNRCEPALHIPIVSISIVLCLSISHFRTVNFRVLK
jgi:hypothetical protein